MSFERADGKSLRGSHFSSVASFGLESCTRSSFPDLLKTLSSIGSSLSLHGSVMIVEVAFVVVQGYAATAREHVSRRRKLGMLGG